MNYKNIKGYEKLSEGAKGVFNHIYKKHQSGVRNKDGWTAVEVRERKKYLEVVFKNCEWLHYYPDGSWG